MSLTVPVLHDIDTFMADSYTPVLGSEHFYWNIASKFGSIKSTDVVSAIGSKVPQAFYIRSEETGQQVMWTRYESNKNKWYYTVLNVEDHPALKDWRIEVEWAS